MVVPVKRRLRQPRPATIGTVLRPKLRYARAGDDATIALKRGELRER